jgi:hypothetical protein
MVVKLVSSILAIPTKSIARESLLNFMLLGCAYWALVINREIQYTLYWYIYNNHITYYTQIRRYQCVYLRV